MPDAIGKPLSFPERAPAATVRRRRWWIAAIIAVVLVVGLSGFAAWYFRACGNCGPIICDDPCSLPTFGQMQVPPDADARSSNTAAMSGHRSKHFATSANAATVTASVF